MRERTINLKIYSRALRVRSMGSHCSPRLDTSRYLFNTDISFLGKKDTERIRKEVQDGEKGDNQNHSDKIVIPFLMLHRLES